MARKNLLKGFKKPKGITFEHLETNPNYGKFTAYPLNLDLEQLSEIHSVVFFFHQFRDMQFLLLELHLMMLMVYLMLFQVNLKTFLMFLKTLWKC